MINFAEGTTRTSAETISRNVSGYFILSPSISPPATFIRTMQQLGVAGIVFGNDLLRKIYFNFAKFRTSWIKILILASIVIPGRIAINGDGKDPSDLVIPVAEIGQEAYAALLDVYLTDDVLMVNLTSQGRSFGNFVGRPVMTFIL